MPAADAVARLARVMADVRPDTVLTFGPDGMTGHVDHRTVSAWTTSAVCQIEPPLAPRLLCAAKTAPWRDRFDALHRSLRLFPPGLPPRVSVGDVVFDLDIPDDLLDRKVAALRAQASQVAPLVDLFGEECFRAWVANECFRPAALVPGSQKTTV